MTLAHKALRLFGVIVIGAVLVLSSRLVISSYEQDLAPTATIVDQILEALWPAIRSRLHEEFVSRARADGTYEELLSRYGAQLNDPKFTVNHGSSSRGSTSPGSLGAPFKEIHWKVEMLTPSTTKVVDPLLQHPPFEQRINVTIKLSESWKSALRNFPGELAILDGGAPQNGLLLETLKRQLIEKGVTFLESPH